MRHSPISFHVSENSVLSAEVRRYDGFRTLDIKQTETLCYGSPAVHVTGIYFSGEHEPLAQILADVINGFYKNLEQKREDKEKAVETAV